MERRRHLQAHAVGVKAVAYGPDGKQLASGNHDDRVRIWDAVTGALKTTLIGHTDHVFRVLSSPDGQWVASSSDDRTVSLWRPNGSDRRVLRGHQADVEELAFSPDGLLISSGEAELVRSSPSGERLAAATAKNVVQLCALSDGACRALEGHATKINAMAFTPDGECLVTASGGGTLRIWDVASGESRPVRGHNASVFDVAISPERHAARLGERRHHDPPVAPGQAASTRRAGGLAREVTTYTTADLSAGPAAQ